MHKILIVDDDESIRKLLRRHLDKLENCTVEESERGDEALMIIEKKHPDLVLLDVMMPDMDGMEVCRRMRENPSMDHIYIILLTAKAESESKVSGFDKGADDYVTKPFDPEELIARVSRGLRTAKDKQKATTDPLTGLNNRRSFNMVLSQEMLEAERYGYALSLVMMDLDHFKKVNDNWGHDVGDDVLVAVGKVIKELCRVSDISSRWGGEEFALLLPRTGMDGAMKVAEKLRSAISIRYFGKAQKLTASFGVSSFESSRRNIFKHADRALYMAKEKGRNRSISAELIIGEREVNG